MRRLFFNVFAAVSLALCVLLTPLWCGRRVTVNLHQSSTEIEVHHDAVYWLYSPANGDYNATVSFFIADPLELKTIFNSNPDELRPAYIRVRANHSSGLWPGGERTGENRDRAGWFRLSFLSALLAAGPLLWAILRLRDCSRRFGAKRPVHIVATARWLCSGLSLAACLFVTVFWISSSRGFHVSLGWAWLLNTEPEQNAITLSVYSDHSNKSAADLWGNWCWIEPQYRQNFRGVAGFHYVRLVATQSMFAKDDTMPLPAAPIGYSLTAPYWFLCAMTALLPACQGLRWIRRRSTARYRSRHGLCRRCGYDLRATQERCPECGGPR